MTIEVIPAEIGEEFKIDGETHVIQPACKNKHNGKWVCLTHRYFPRHQFDKDTHISTPGPHKMAWICLEHGLEKP